jgi:hypothetical protein
MRFKVQLGVLIVLLAGCGKTYNLDYLSNYEPGQDYTKYKTFNFYKVTGTAPHATSNELDARLRPAVELGLFEEGFTKAEQPDFWVKYHIDVKGRENLDPVITSVGLQDKEEFKSGALVLDFIDATTNQRYWRGVVIGDIAERTPKDRLETAVRRILENYPPED